jgi:hypothetical protein
MRLGEEKIDKENALATVQGCNEQSETDDEGEGTRVSEMWGLCSLIMPLRVQQILR